MSRNRLDDLLKARLIVCTGLKRWEMGAEFARQITPDCTLSAREAAGRFHLAHAEAL